MSEFKGTPGPWFYHREGFSTVYIEARLRQGVIQEVAACGPTEAGQEQQLSNAKLIAASPELLEACQRARNQFYAAGYEPKAGSMNPTECLLAQLIAAISKATGE